MGDLINFSTKRCTSQHLASAVFACALLLRHSYAHPDLDNPSRDKLSTGCPVFCSLSGVAAPLVILGGPWQLVKDLFRLPQLFGNAFGPWASDFGLPAIPMPLVSFPSLGSLAVALTA